MRINAVVLRNFTGTSIIIGVLPSSMLAEPAMSASTYTVSMPEGVATDARKESSRLVENRWRAREKGRIRPTNLRGDPRLRHFKLPRASETLMEKVPQEGIRREAIENFVKIKSAREVERPKTQIEEVVMPSWLPQAERPEEKVSGGERFLFDSETAREAYASRAFPADDSITLDVYVSVSTGSDGSGDGSPGNPYV